MAKKKRPEPQPAPKFGPLFDAHTHLASCGARSADQVQALLDRAADAGVVGVCTIGDGLEETELAYAAAHADPRVWAATAIHPTRAGELDDEAKTRLSEMARDPRVVAIGETGLDWYWIGKKEGVASREQQIEAMQWHAELARAVNKPLMIHNREADADLLDQLQNFEGTVILHCFSSPLEVAHEAIDRGYILSFTGNVTFKRNDDLRQAVADAPLENLLVETDAPYMTPEPYRGTRNEPTYIGWQVRTMAEARGMEPAEMAQQLVDNACRIYGVQLP